MYAHSAAMPPRFGHYQAGRGDMAAPPTPQPSLLDLVLGSALLAAIMPMLRDLWRGMRRDSASVEVAKIKSRDERIAALEERMDRRDEEHVKEITDLRREAAEEIAQLRRESESDRRALRMEQDSMRREIAAIALRMDNAIGGDPAELLVALREIVYELRALAGHETFPGKPTIIGNIEPKRGEVPPLE